MIPPENFDHDNPLDCNLQHAMGALPCDAHHHYYHYQSSIFYTWLARTCFALGLHKQALEALTKALFQDHFNAEALAMKAAGKADGVAQSYDKHPESDAAFCASIGQPADAATALHDAAQFEAALALSPAHSNSHFGFAKVLFARKEYEKAREHFSEAIRLSHIAHDAYHRAASAEHVKRGREFLAKGELELAINDFTKALDLHRGNEEASREREQAQRMRNS